MKFHSFIALFILAACSSPEGQNNTVEHGHSERRFRTGPVQTDTMTEVIQVTGVVDVPPQSIATVSAPLGGFMREVRFYPGDRVNKGQILARVVHPQYVELQRTYLEAKAQVAFLESDLRRKDTLLSRDAVSTRVVEELRASRDAQKAAMMAAAASLNQVGIDASNLTAERIQSELILRSPISGYITHIDANPGQHVTPEQALYRIIDDDHMHIELMVYPRDIHKIAAGQRIRFRIPGSDLSFGGEVKLVGRQVHRETGAFEIHAHPDDDATGLRPGQYVEGEILRNPRVAFVIPESAVAGEDGKYYVFIASEGEYRKQAVRVGQRGNGRVEILDSITGPIVLEGAHLLLEPGGHEH